MNAYDYSGENTSIGDLLLTDAQRAVSEEQARQDRARGVEIRQRMIADGYWDLELWLGREGTIFDGP